MLHIRTTRTSSGATAIQVVRYVARKMIVVKHIGSAHTDGEREVLCQEAKQYIERTSGQAALWCDTIPASSHLLDLRSCRYRGSRHTLAYDVLRRSLRTVGFSLPPLLQDLTVMRLLEPSSKHRSLERLEQLIGIRHRRQAFYEMLPRLLRRKRDVERHAVTFARERLSFDCSLVLYDVTTLYFESFREDKEETGLRKTGFSKDQKPQQPQIVVGLLVTSQGFPLGYEIFRGSTFEGHTMLPVLLKFCRRYDIATCTVVADAAMLSMENITELRRKEISYIVGARVANLSPTRIEQIAVALGRRDGATTRLPTQHGDLICSLSQERFRKDKHEMDRQIARAEKLVASREPGRRAKFVQTRGTTYALNKALIAKTERLLGIKGYVTNIPRETMSDHEVIAHYRNLWHVEQTFRMAKGDLEARPVFHHTDDTIRAHLLICFMALAVGKYLEIMTERSLRKVIDALMSVTDAKITDGQGKTITLRSEPSREVQEILEKLGASD